MSVQEKRLEETSKGEGTFLGSDGNELFMRWACPASSRGVVVVVHGAGEHSGRYVELWQALLAAGYSCYGYDHRGHGQSAGRRSHIGKFDEYLADLNCFLEEVQKREGKGKVFVYGHSMGGLIASLYAIRYQPTLWGMVLSAPPYKLAVQVPKVKIIAAKVLSNIVPILAMASEVDSGHLSRDPKVGKEYEADPLVCRKATTRWGAEFLDAMDRANARAHEFSLATLLVQGEGDQVVDAAGAREFFGKISSDDKELKVYPELYHELHHELESDRNAVFNDVISWLDQRSGS